jgi:AraC family transcriptional regulator
MDCNPTVLASADVLPFIERVSEAVSQRHAAEAGWRNVLAWTLDSPPGRLELPGFDDHHLIVHLSERSKMALGFAGGRPQDHILMTGAMSFIPAGVPATFDIQSRNQSLHVLLPRRILARVAEETQVSPELHPFVGRLTPDLVSTAMLLQRELVEPRIGSSALADGVLQVLAVHVLRELAPAGTTRRERVWLLSERQVRQAIGFMRANLQEDLSLKDIAEAVGLSVYHFARAFRATVGVPPHQYLIQLRISRARELLASGDLALAQIAFETGFKSQSHFTYAFKRTLRVTPREYRRIART